MQVYSPMVLQNICEFIVDCPHSTSPDEGNGYPIIRTPNVGNGRLLLDAVQRVSKEVYDKRNKRAIPQVDDIIFAREAPAGNAAIICEGQDVCLGQRTVLIRPNREKVYPKFLIYYILAPEQQYKLLGTANGATVAHVNIPVIKNMTIKLPSMKEQIRIANFLSAYDDLIENNQKQIKLLEEVAQRLYKEWFVDLRFPGHEDVPFVDGLPEGWERDILEKIAFFKRGKTITREQICGGNVPVVAGGLEPAYYHNKSNTVAPVITVSGSGANAGFTRLYNVDIFASDCSFVDSKTTLHLYFVYCFLKANKASLDALQKGSAQPHVYAKDVNAMKINVPTKQCLDLYNKRITPYFDMIKSLQKQIKLLSEARDRLLPKLMSCELEL